MPTNLNPYITLLTHFDELRFGRPIDETGRNPDSVTSGTLTTNSKFGAGAAVASDLRYGGGIKWPMLGTFQAGSPAIFDPGAGDFCVDAQWFLPPGQPNSAVAAGDYDIVIAWVGGSPHGTGGAHVLYLAVDAFTGRVHAEISTTAGIVTMMSSVTPSMAGFEHVALQRLGGVFSLYANGVLVDQNSTYAAPLSTPVPGGVPSEVALYSAFAYPVSTAALAAHGPDAYIDELRVMVGSAPYIGSTYVTPSAPYAFGAYMFANCPSPTCTALASMITTGSAAIAPPAPTLSAGMFSYTSALPGVSSTTGTPAVGIADHSVGVSIVEAYATVAVKYDLLAQTTYTITLNGSLHSAGTMSDPMIVGIYDSGGAFQSGSANDDFNGRDSQVTFTPSLSGVYAISTRGYGSGIGSMTLMVSAPVYVPPVAGGDTATVAIAGPSPRLLALGGVGATIRPPSPAVWASGRPSAGDYAIYAAAPSARVASWGGANASVSPPRGVVVTTAETTSVATAAIAAPSGALVARAIVAGTSQAAIQAPSPNLIGYGGAVCSITLIGKATLVASGTTGGIGGVRATCPLFQLVTVATAQSYGSANLLAPSPKLGGQAQAWIMAPGARLTAVGSAVITATYEAYAVNLLHTARPGVEPVDEVTHYTNFPFTHVVRYKNSYYGANSTGLYLLEGTTDDAAPITWGVKTAMTDFKSTQRKTVASAFFGGRLGPADTITLHAGEGAQTQPYSYTTPRGALAQNYRQVFGKGIKSHRYYALAATGSGEMALDNVDLDVHNLTRRI